MKTGLTLTAMATELERRNDAKRDFVADTRTLLVSSDAKDLSMDTGREDVKHTLITPMRDLFTRQLEQHYRVPAEYSERIRAKHPELYAHTLNTFFSKEPTRRMVRTLDGHARAFLSDRYRPLDDYDLANAVLPELLGRDGVRIESTQFTEQRFYLKAVFPRIETEVSVGDPVQIGLVVSNSEVGAGALQVMPLVYRLVCKNGMIAQDYGQRKYHVGRKAEGEGNAFELYSEGTQRLTDAAFFAQVRDTVRGVLTHATLERIVQGMRDAKEQRIESNDLQAVVEVTGKRFGYNDTTKGGILRHLIEGGDLTRYGLLNALTRQSQDEDDYALATKLECDGAKIIELPKNDWRAIADGMAKAA